MAATPRVAAEAVGAARLWLSPKLPPEVELTPEWLALADTWLLDTYRAYLAEENERFPYNFSAVWDELAVQFANNG